jgi:hypothetical protein
MVIEVTAYERLRRLGSSTQLSLMEIHGTLAFEPFREGTRMHWEWDVEPRGLFKPFGSIVAWMGRRQERRIWANLKRYLEAQSDAVIVPQE